METEVVIRLPQNLYLDVKNGHASNIQRERVIEQVKNGTVLPEGHGRLCDIDAALKCMEEVADDKTKIKECAIGFFDWACSKRVVLEADKEEEK